MVVKVKLFLLLVTISMI